MTSELRFGTDGIRGRAGETPITPEVGLRVGRAAVALAGGPGQRVMIARDTRPSGPMLEAAVAAGVAGAGGQALLAGLLPTSGLACALAEGLADVGVMLTASHNPHDDNGFKVLGPGGRKLTEEETAATERWLLADPVVTEPGPVFAKEREAFDAYARRLRAALPDLSFLAGRKITIDLANGAGVAMARWLHELLPCELLLIGAGDGLPNDGLGSEHPEGLSMTVIAGRCDGGFAIDGDGDRCRLVDARGRIVDGDALCWLLARGRGDEAVAVTVMSTAALEPSLPGVSVVRTPVGDKHLADAMAKGLATLGCEESGHVLFSDALPTGDGLVTGLRALAYAFAAGTVADAVGGFKPYPKKVTKVKVKSRPPLTGVPAIEAARIEGEKALGSGRVFLRYSGTEPVLRILVEGADAAVVDKVSSDVTEACKRAIGV